MRRRDTSIRRNREAARGAVRERALVVLLHRMHRPA